MDPFSYRAGGICLPPLSMLGGSWGGGGGEGRLSIIRPDPTVVGVSLKGLPLILASFRVP